MERMNFEQVREFVRDHTRLGFFSVREGGIEIKTKLPIYYTEILSIIPEEGLDYTMVEFDGGIREKNFWVSPLALNVYLGELVRDGFLVKENNFYNLSNLTKSAEYEYIPLGKK